MREEREVGRRNAQMIYREPQRAEPYASTPPDKDQSCSAPMAAATAASADNGYARRRNEDAAAKPLGLGGTCRVD
jgi:hypothetical protein